ncbi:MAG: C13 family peptidase [Acidobacteriota bacterium]
MRVGGAGWLAIAVWLLGIASGPVAGLPAWEGAAQAPSSAYLVIIEGIGGDSTSRQAFHQLAVKMIDSAQQKLGLAASNIVYLAEEPDLDPERITGRSTKEEIEQTLGALAARVAPQDRIFILLIGHGSSSGQSRFNLPGPDMTAGDFASLLDLFPTQRLAFIHTGSASGGFVKALSGNKRTIITATRDQRQYNETVFPRFFVEAFASDVADLDKNKKVSLLEAFEYARREVQRFYNKQGRLLTETALLDDNGDGTGSHEPDSRTSDGATARSFFLAQPGPVRPAGTVSGGNGDAEADAELRALVEQRQALEESITHLKEIKKTLDPELYMKKLEDLLIELALKNRAIRERGGSKEQSSW